MYSREAGDQVHTFEASGGLLYGGLVMYDRETSSLWSMLSNTAIAGSETGSKLVELPGAEKMTWAEWKKRHPETKILSVNGREHDPMSPYESYFRSSQGFRGIQASDDRLEDKTLIFTFQHDGKAVAVPFESFFGGGVAELGERQLFLYREKKDSHYRSTSAFLARPGSRFVKMQGTWRILPEEFSWSESERRFEGDGSDSVEELVGMDTFWYSWSLTNDGAEILTPEVPEATP